MASEEGGGCAQAGREVRIIVGDGGTSQSQHTEKGVPSARGRGLPHTKVSRWRCVLQCGVWFPFTPRGREEMLSVSVIVHRKAPCPGHSLLQCPPGRTSSGQKVGSSRQYTIIYRIVTVSSHPKIVTEL